MDGASDNPVSPGRDAGQPVPPPSAAAPPPEPRRWAAPESESGSRPGYEGYDTGTHDTGAHDTGGYDPRGYDPRSAGGAAWDQKNAKRSPAARPAEGQGPTDAKGSGRPGAVRGWDREARPSGRPAVPVALRPMTMSDLLDGAWAIITCRPKTVFAITALIMIPTELVAAFLQRGAAQNFQITTLFLNTQAFNTSSNTPNLGMLGLALLGSALSALAYFFLGGALAHLVSSWYAGRDVSAREAVLASLRMSHLYLAAFALLLIPKLVAYALCFLPVVFLLPTLMLTAPVMMIEKVGPIRGALRSFKLVGRRYWWCVLVWLLAYVIEFAANLSLSALPALVAEMTPQVLADLLVPIGSTFARFMTAPFVVGVCVLLYLDLRVRTEGLDLEIEATDAFARAA